MIERTQKWRGWDREEDVEPRSQPRGPVCVGPVFREREVDASGIPRPRGTFRDGPGTGGDGRG